MRKFPIVLRIFKAKPSCPVDVMSGTIAKDLVRNVNAPHETL